MSFVKDWAYSYPTAPVETLPLKVQLLNLLEDFLHENGIETVRSFGPAGLYKVDLIEKIGEELQGIPDEQVRASLKKLVSKASIIVGAPS